MKITILNDSIIRQEVDAIVNPANSFGFMGGGAAGALKASGGNAIEEEAIGAAPVEIGSAVLTTSGDLKCLGVIHAPTMRNPAEETNGTCVGEATRAALELADLEGFKKIAFPGMGTGVGKVPVKEAAEEMVRAIFEFEPECLEEVVLVDIDEEMVEAWKGLVK